MRAPIMLLCASHAAATSVTARLNLTSTRPLDGSLFVGYNTGGAGLADENLTLPVALSAAAALQPGTLRYPGGTQASYWDWRSGGCLKNLSLPGPLPNECNALYSKSPWPLEKFAVLLNATGAQPVWNLNVQTSNPAEQVAMLRAAAGLGLAVDLVELGNEYYLCGANMKLAFPTVADYVRTANSFAAAVKAAFPSASVAAVGSLFDGDSCGGRRPTWDKGLRELDARYVDAITIHPYLLLADQVGELTNYSYGNATQQARLATFLRNESAASGFLGQPDAIYADGRVVAEFNEALGPNRHMRRWVTEWNMVPTP